MQGRGGDSSGSSSKECMSTVSKEEEAVVMEEDYVGTSELTSYDTSASSSSGSKCMGEEDGAELELGLGLGLGLGSKAKRCSSQDYCRILTANKFPSLVSASPSPASTSLTRAVSGTKRAADSVSQDVGSNSQSQVIGWPPIRAYRRNSLVNQSRVSAEDGTDISKKDGMKMGSCNSNIKNNQGKGNGKSMFVKVNMDGVPIGRKVDLNAHLSYETLAQALEDMFHRPTISTSSMIPPNGLQEDSAMVEAMKSSKLLDGSSEFVLTYEDREGDWMLVGDVPWRMFLSTVKRLRIMKTSANRLAPRFQHHKSDRQRSKPV